MLHVDKRQPVPAKPTASKAQPDKPTIREKAAQLQGYDAQAKALQPGCSADGKAGPGHDRNPGSPRPGLEGATATAQADAPIATKAQAPESVCDYDGLTTYFADPQQAERGLDLEAEGIRVQRNGGLFLEAINNAASDAYDLRLPMSPPTTREEKLHVPATGKDVAQRWAIVSKHCVARGMLNWKVAKAELIDNKVSGAERAFELLSKAGLLDKDAKPGLDAAMYVKQAMHKGRREALRKFIGSPDAFDKWTDSVLVHEVIRRIEDSVLDANAFPEEQTGREITVYIHPDLLKTSKAWSEFVSDLYADLEASGLPMLPIAVGDKAVAGGAVKSKGQTLGYFSYRNEANATDALLGYRGFPHWAGGNAANANAGGDKMQLDKAKVTKPRSKKGGRRAKA